MDLVAFVVASPVMAALAAVSVFALAVVLDRLFAWVTVRKGLSHPETLIAMARTGDRAPRIREKAADLARRNPFARIFVQWLDANGHRGHVEQAVAFEEACLDRNMWILDCAATIGPLLGILGTLVGISTSFGGFRAIAELNPATVHEQSRRGRPVIFGDVGNLEVLEAAGIGNAHALVLTIPDEEAVLRACATAQRRAPDVFIVARTRVVSKRAGLMEVGADSVTVDETSAATEMLRAVMACIDAGTEEEPLGTEPESDPHTVSEGCDEDQ